MSEVSAAPNLLEQSFTVVNAHVVATFEKNKALYGDVLYATRTKGLSTEYMEGFADEAVRHHHDCQCCRDFIRNIGGAVFIKENGDTVSAFWDEKDAPVGFEASFALMRKFVEKQKVIGSFYAMDNGSEHWGRVESGGFNHFAIPALADLTSLTPRAKMNVSKERFKNLLAMLDDFPLPALREAKRVLESGSLNSPEKFLPMVEFAIKYKLIRENEFSEWRNLLRVAVATSPDGWCEMRSSMVGNLITWVREGRSFNFIQRTFNENTKSINYQRAVAPASAGNIKSAEKLIEELGLADSLKRRLATFEEIKPYAKWLPQELEAPAAPEAAGVFGHLKPKGVAEAVKGPSLNLPAVSVSWTKFQRDILPNAKKIEVHFLHGKPQGFGGIATEAVAGSKPILKWDTEEFRNPFSMYFYNGGCIPQQVGIDSGWKEVTGVFQLTHQWNPNKPMPQFGEGLYLTVGGVVPDPTLPSALFPETLISELHGVRSTIESYSKNTPMGSQENVDALGLMINPGATLRVTKSLEEGPLDYHISIID